MLQIIRDALANWKANKNGKISIKFIFRLFIFNIYLFIEFVFHSYRCVFLAWAGNRRMKEYDTKCEINIIYIYIWILQRKFVDKRTMKNSCSNDLFTYVTSCFSTMRKWIFNIVIRNKMRRVQSLSVM